jgi:hypothetical protein
MPYRYRCTETLLTDCALFETLVFLYQPSNQIELNNLLSFASAACDSFVEVDGKLPLWQLIADRLRWRPKQKHLSNRDLAIIADEINADVRKLNRVLSFLSRNSTAPTLSAEDEVIWVDCCSSWSLTRDALVTTLSFLFQPKGTKERRQVVSFAAAVCRVWSAVNDDAECWQAYTGWLRTQLHLAKRPTCANLGSLAEKMEEHLMVLHSLTTSNPASAADGLETAA